MSDPHIEEASHIFYCSFCKETKLDIPKLSTEQPVHICHECARLFVNNSEQKKNVKLILRLILSYNFSILIFVFVFELLIAGIAIMALLIKDS